MENIKRKLNRYINYNDNYYFYYESYSNGDIICEEGLLLNDENILDKEHILFSSAHLLEIDMLGYDILKSSYKEFNDIIILGIPKEDVDYVVDLYNYGLIVNKDYTADYIIDPKYVLGYIDMQNEDFIFNKNYFEQKKKCKYYKKTANV